MTLTSKPEPTRYDIPEGATWTPCRSCGVAITFVPTSKGHKMPITQDGTSHFIDCPGASTHRKKGKGRNG